MDKQKFLTKFDELEIIAAGILEEVENETEEQRADRLCDEVLDMLIDIYVFGVFETGEMLNTKTEVNTDEMYESVYRRIEGKNFEDRIREYVKEGTIGEIARVIDTDTHRVLNEGIYNAAKSTNANVRKTWRTMEDMRVRDSHFYLENVSVGLDEYFYTYTGEKALYPGGFGTPEEDCNCRCVIEITNR